MPTGAGYGETGGDVGERSPRLFVPVPGCGPPGRRGDPSARRRSAPCCLDARSPVPRTGPTPVPARRCRDRCGMSWSRAARRRHEHGIAQVEGIQGDAEGRRRWRRVLRHRLHRDRDRDRQRQRSIATQRQEGTFAFECRLQQGTIAGDPRQGGFGDTSGGRQVLIRVYLRRRAERLAYLARQSRRVDEGLRVRRATRVAERHDEYHATEPGESTKRHGYPPGADGHICTGSHNSGRHQVYPILAGGSPTRAAARVSPSLGQRHDGRRRGSRDEQYRAMARWRPHGPWSDRPRRRSHLVWHAPPKGIIG